MQGLCGSEQKKPGFLPIFSAPGFDFGELQSGSAAIETAVTADAIGGIMPRRGVDPKAEAASAKENGDAIIAAWIALNMGSGRGDIAAEDLWPLGEIAGRDPAIGPFVGDIAPAIGAAGFHVHIFTGIKDVDHPIG